MEFVSQKTECKLEEESLPPAYREDVRNLIAHGKPLVKSRQLWPKPLSLLSYLYSSFLGAEICQVRRYITVWLVCCTLNECQHARTPRANLFYVIKGNYGPNKKRSHQSFYVFRNNKRRLPQRPNCVANHFKRVQFSFPWFFSSCK